MYNSGMMAPLERASALLRPVVAFLGNIHPTTASRLGRFSGTLPLIAVVVIFGGQALGVELDGRLMSDLYVYEQGDKSHVRPYLSTRADLTAWRSIDRRSLTFHTYLRWSSDFSDKLATDPQTFVYHAYVRLAGIPKATDIYLGRQFVYCGVGSALLDGLRIRYQPFRTLNLDVFGGSSVSSEDPEQIRSFSDFRTLGGRAAFAPRPSVRLGLSWMLRKTDGQLSYNRLGLDGEKTFGQYRLFGRASYNLVGSRLAEILMRASYSHAGWYLCGEFDRREPSVAANSLFGILDFRDYKQARLDVQRTILRNLTVVSQMRVDFLTGEDSWRGSLGLRTSYAGISWHHQSGYGGDSDGMSGSVNLRLDPRWELFSTANLHRYKVQVEQKDRSDAYSTSLGLLWRPVRGLTARVEGQYLRNAVRGHDTRVLLRLTKDFSLGHNSGKEE